MRMSKEITDENTVNDTIPSAKTTKSYVMEKSCGFS